MPKLKLTVDKLEDVKEDLRPLYVEREGKFELDVDGVPELRTALKTANGEAMRLRQRYKDIDPEEVGTLKTSLEQTTRELEELRQKSGPEAVAAVKEQLLKAHGAEKVKLEQRLARLQDNLSVALVDGEATRALAAAKGSPELLLPHIRRCVKIAESDAGFTIQVVDDKGQPRVRDDGAPMTITNLVEEFKNAAAYGRAFDSSGASGAGSGNGSGGGGAAKKRSAMGVEEKSAYIAQHGQEEYLKLPY